MGLNTLKKQVLDGADLSGNVQSEWLNCEHITLASFSFLWSNGSSLSGTLSIEAANASDQSDAETILLSTLTGPATGLTVSGASGSHFLSGIDVAARYLRLVYTSSAGTGSADAWAMLKGDAN